MKRVWEKIVATFTAPVSRQTEHREEAVQEHVTRIRRKMRAGTWQFSWREAGRTHLTSIQPNLPALLIVIRRTASAIDVGAPLPLEAKRSRQTNMGVVSTSLKQFMADDEGLYQDPKVLVESFIDESIRLCDAISRLRKKSPKLAESFEGQCVYLLAEVEYVAALLL